MKNDNAQSFNTRCEETVIAMKYHSDDEIWDFVSSSASTVRTAEVIANSVHVQDIVQKGESQDYVRVKKTVVRYLERITREKRFSSRE